MKKRLLVLALATGMLLTGCGNQALGMGTFTFNHIHFTDNVTGYCGTVEKWHDNETGIEVKTSEYGSMYCSEGSYILFGNGSQCPYCE